MESQPHGMSDLCRCILRSADARDDQRRTDRHHPLLFRDDYPHCKAGALFSGNSAGTRTEINLKIFLSINPIASFMVVLSSHSSSRLFSKIFKLSKLFNFSIVLFANFVLSLLSNTNGFKTIKYGFIFVSFNISVKRSEKIGS